MSESFWQDDTEEVSVKEEESRHDGHPENTDRVDREDGTDGHVPSIRGRPEGTGQAVHVRRLVARVELSKDR